MLYSLGLLAARTRYTESCQQPTLPTNETYLLTSNQKRTQEKQDTGRNGENIICAPVISFAPWIQLCLKPTPWTSQSLKSVNLSLFFPLNQFAVGLGHLTNKSIIGDNELSLPKPRNRLITLFKHLSFYVNFLLRSLSHIQSQSSQ